MNKAILKYTKKALSEENRKVYDGDSNCPYMLQISMAEIGPMDSDGEGTFWLQAKIPRQVDNCLGMTLEENVYTRKEAIKFFKEVIKELQAKA